MESIDGRNEEREEGEREREGELIEGGCGIPFLHNLAVPVGLVLANSMIGGGSLHTFHSEYAGFMNEGDFERITAGTWMNKPTIKKKTKRQPVKSLKITRKR